MFYFISSVNSKAPVPAASVDATGAAGVSAVTPSQRHVPTGPNKGLSFAEATRDVSTLPRLPREKREPDIIPTLQQPLHKDRARSAFTRTQVKVT